MIGLLAAVGFDVVELAVMGISILRLTAGLEVSFPAPAAEDQPTMAAQGSSTPS